MSEFIKLYKKIRKGDKQAFEVLFKELYKPLCAYAFNYIKQREDVEEVVQDVFFKIWMKRKDIYITTDLKSYLYKSVKNRCLVFIQHQKVKMQYAKYISDDWVNERYDVEEYVNAQELESAIGYTLNGLPDRMRQIFIMSRYENLKYQEIAWKLSVSVKTVEANISKALKIFRKNLGEFVKVST